MSTIRIIMPYCMTLRLICVLSKYVKINMYCAETLFAGGLLSMLRAYEYWCVFYMLAECISLIVIFVLLYHTACPEPHLGARAVLQGPRWTPLNTTLRPRSIRAMGP